MSYFYSPAKLAFAVCVVSGTLCGTSHDSLADEMLDVSLSCPATTAAGALQVISKSRHGTRTIVVTFADNAIKNIKIYGLVPGGNPFLWENVDVAKIDKMDDEDVRLASSISKQATQLKTEVCEGDADAKRKYFATLKQNEIQFSGSANQGGGDEGDWLVIAGAWPPTEEYKIKARTSLLSRSGIAAKVIKTDDYPGLTPGLVAVVMGPTSKERAQEQLENVKSLVSDAFIKQGR